MRILVVKLSSIGDIFHVLPTVCAIKQALGAEIDWVTQREYVPLVQCFPDISRVFAVDRRRFVRSVWALRRELRECRYDVVVDLQGLMKSALVGLQVKAGRRIGPSYRREGAGVFYSEAAPLREERRHAVDEAVDVLALRGVERPEKPVWRVAFPQMKLAAGAPRIGLLPVSRWASKNWPPEYYTKLARRLKDRLPGARFFLMGGPTDQGVCDRIAGELDFEVENLCGTCSLPETGGVMAGLDLLVAGDSGPTHMAVAAGTRCLVLYGPTAPGRTGPYGDPHRALEQEAACRPCRHRTCPIDHRCLRGLQVERVVQQALEMLAE